MIQWTIANELHHNLHDYNRTFIIFQFFQSGKNRDYPSSKSGIFYTLLSVPGEVFCLSRCK